MNNKLVILQITNRVPYPLNDGGNIATYYVTKYLNRFGHRVILASLNTKKHHQDPSTLADIAKVYTTDLDTSITPLGLLKGVVSKTPYNVDRFVSEEFSEQLSQIVVTEKPDIIQLEGIYLAVYFDVLRKKTSVPILLRSHNVEFEIWKRTAENEKNILKRIYLRQLSRKIEAFEKTKMHLFNGILAITERDREFYQRNNYKGALKTIPAGVDPETIPDSVTQNTGISLCFLGSMEWLPNVQGIEWYLTKVWPVLRQKYPALTLHIAGKNMSEEMKSRKIEGVYFHGMVPDAGVFLNQHAVMIVPLLSGGGMRLKIVEAMAYGRCVVSTSIGAEGVEAKDTEEIIIANTPEEFISRTEELIAGKINAQRIGNNAHKLVQEKYSWEKLVRGIEKFYLELI